MAITKYVDWSISQHVLTLTVLNKALYNCYTVELKVTL